MKTIVSVDRLKLYAFHGVLPQERLVGNDYEVSVSVGLDIDDKILEADELNGTVNYAELVNIIKEEMAEPSLLIENVAYRILTKVRSLGEKVLHIKAVDVVVSKLTPPIPNTEVEAASVKIEWRE